MVQMSWIGALLWCYTACFFCSSCKSVYANSENLFWNRSACHGGSSHFQSLPFSFSLYLMHFLSHPPGEVFFPLYSVSLLILPHCAIRQNASESITVASPSPTLFSSRLATRLRFVWIRVCLSLTRKPHRKGQRALNSAGAVLIVARVWNYEELDSRTNKKGRRDPERNSCKREDKYRTQYGSETKLLGKFWVCNEVSLPR